MSLILAKRYLPLALVNLTLWLANLSGQPQELLLPKEVLAFPGESIGNLQPPPVVIWSEKKLLAWALARGFSFSRDSAEGGWQFGRAAMLECDSYRFSLYAPVDLRGSTSPTGWHLVLDFAAPIFDSRQFSLASEKTTYPAVSLAEIYVDGILATQINAGWGRSFQSPLKIAIPYIRHPEGKVTVEIRLANRPDNVLFLYDAFLTR